MRKLYTILALFVVFNMFAQEVVSISTLDLRYKSPSLNSKEIEDIQIDGSPYLYPNFVQGTVDGFKETYLMRYNAFLDEVTFKKGNVEFALLKENLYRTIHFKETDEILKLENYNYKKNKILGYLFLIAHNSNISIYKKVSITFSHVVPNVNSYFTGKRSSYKLARDEYFIKNGNSEIVELPSSKNKLISMFPEKKEIINQYFKANKVNLSDSGDLKKLVQIL